jgi:hypothetical protein
MEEVRRLLRDQWHTQRAQRAQESAAAPQTSAEKAISPEEADLEARICLADSALMILASRPLLWRSLSCDGRPGSDVGLVSVGTRLLPRSQGLARLM